MKYFCCEEHRLAAVRDAGVLNGIEYIEVSDSEAPTEALRQRTLFVRLLLAPVGLNPSNIMISGGDRIPTVDVEFVTTADALPVGEDPTLVDGIDDPERVLVVRTESRGDFSLYTFSIVAGAGSLEPPGTFDPLLASVDFSFKVECPTDFDCKVDDSCAPDVGPTPAIDYLAKDYGAFRRLMLDRMSLLTPDWAERAPADIGIALVETLAYVADELSYRQDAVATEAYLGTARRRASLRRLARLVDYRVHEGTNARVWLRVEPEADGVEIPAQTAVLTRVPNTDAVLEPGGPEHRRALIDGAETFEVVESKQLFLDNRTFSFWTWGDTGCCLPPGTTSATLLGHHVDLVAGDVLILTEVVGAETGVAADADPARRVAVRLVNVEASSDPSGGRFSEPPTNDAVDVTEIEWHAEDALPFPLCLSATHLPDVEVSVAWGNIVLADHGQTIVEEDLGAVPEPVLELAVVGSHCDPADVQPVPPRYRPRLANAPLTYSRPAPTPATSAFAATATSISVARPHAFLVDAADASPTPVRWQPRFDLLNSDDDAREFIVEAEHDSTATIRFGDDVHGRRPEPGTTFLATYRVGNGPAGNVGANAIAHLVTDTVGLLSVENPIAAIGGIAPETADAIRRDAPEAFLVQQRAVTPADYEDKTALHPDVERAAGTFRWTGSWHTVFVTADRVGGLEVDAEAETGIRRHLEPFRMAGYDLEVDSPIFVPLRIELELCAEPDHFRADVKRAALDVVSSRRRRDGSLGLFHPDLYTFGQPVYRSAIVAAVQRVPGVESVRMVVFERQRDSATSGLATGVLPMGRLEIARLDNDPNFPERGTITIEVRGGK